MTSTNQPHWVKKYFCDQQILELEQTVKQIEADTSGEVVVVITESSSTVSHVPLVMFFFLLLTMVLVDLPHITQSFDSEYWWPLWAFPLLALLLTRALSSLPFVQRALTPKSDRIEQVETRAELEFYRNNLKHTDQGTGVLLFVSLLERQAVILGDQQISSKINQEQWQEILNDFLKEAKKGNHYQGIKQSLWDIGKVLTKDFPAPHKNPNELPDHVLFR